MPKLEYLTIMDYLILISYFYATIPNFLSIAQYNYLKSRKSNLSNLCGNYGKRYGLPSYIGFIIIIILINTDQVLNKCNVKLDSSFF